MIDCSLTSGLLMEIILLAAINDMVQGFLRSRPVTQDYLWNLLV